jgi:hypothetical protein
VRGDDDDRRVRILLHDRSKIIEALATVGRGAAEVEVEQDGVWALALEQRQELGRRTQRLDALEQVAQRKLRRQGDVRIVVDDHR